MYGRRRRELRRGAGINSEQRSQTTEPTEKASSDNKNTNEDTRKLFKKELLNVFRKFGYLADGKDCEITIRTTSGSIAWININSIETIK
ncbi:MAG: hypothetical protein HY757_03735 [Nitrospirae bacterium]|nr:hypothetical protein [Nitrospirota bacterium]